jgi:serine protease
MNLSSWGWRLSIASLMVAAALTVSGLAAAPTRAASSVATWEPNDPGSTGVAGGWQELQWNFADADNGVYAPEAWENLIRDHRAGASGVTIAVLDTGVAYRNWGSFRKSPDFSGTRFVDPCDLVAGTIEDGRCTDPHPLDRDGHGTWVAGEIAEATNNRLGVTGLAYRAAIMPVRVLNAAGWAYPSTVAEGIRYAVDRGASVINLSLSFYLGMTAEQIPTLISAISYAHSHGVVVVAAAGNDEADQIAYPARDPDVISVGATTADGCLAAYSDDGPQLDLVAPGGGDDAALKEAACDSDRHLPNLYQMTFANRDDPTAFSLPGNWYGTSMAAPEVSAAAAMVIASGVLGPHPTPNAIRQRLEQTATQPIPQSAGGHNDIYGYGIVNIGAATSPPA